MLCIYLYISLKISLQFQNNSKQLILFNMTGSTGLWLFMLKHLKVASGGCSLGVADEAWAGDGSYLQGAHSVSRHMLLERKISWQKVQKKITAWT